MSGGQQQRAALARALVASIELVLFDEPLSNLDAKLRVEMRGEIRRLHEQAGRTSVYVTHDREEALAISDRVVVMVDGGIAQPGSPREVYTNPKSAFVADFMGAENVLAVTAPIGQGSGPVVRTRDGSQVELLEAASCGSPAPPTPPATTGFPARSCSSSTWATT